MDSSWVGLLAIVQHAKLVEEYSLQREQAAAVSDVQSLSGGQPGLGGLHHLILVCNLRQSCHHANVR